MAGMLPGVEAARRRRIYQGCSSWSSSSGPTHPTLAHLSSPSSRRSSFSLFFPSTSLRSRSRSRSRVKGNESDDKLGQLAREAKERLDERLRAQRESPLIQAQRNRNHSEMSQERNMNRRRRSHSQGRELRTEVYGGSRNKLIAIGWALGGGLGWKTREQQECAVCLEEFKAGDNLVNMPCSHRFHSRCLLPWLDTSAHCPCCRMSIFS